MASEHTAKAFDSDLQELTRLVAEMGGLAERMITESVDALVRRDVALGKRVVAADAEIDSLQRVIEERAVLTIARRQPMAVDLREIVGAMRVATDLERIGDLAKNMGKRVAALDSDFQPLKLIRGLEHMTDLVQSQVKSVLDAYAAHDLPAAMAVWKGDEEVDAICTSLFRELLTYMMEDPRNISFCIHLMFCAKNIERIGDHATNIAETVFYMIEGQQILDKRPKGDMTTFATTVPGNCSACERRASKDHMNARILVVEDEEALTTLLRYNLDAEGYDVETVGRGDDADTRLKERVPDLIVLDWMLPGLSGIELCRRLRARPETKALPIIMLTARGEESERVRGLATGADDYIVKPFSVPELLARVKGLLRRASPERLATVLAYGDIELDREKRRVARSGRPIDLGPTEYRLLEFFLEHPGRVFSREQLLDSVWGRDIYIDERTVDVHIGRLRKLLNPGREQDPIRTVRGAGYALDDRFAKVGVIASGQADSPSSRRKRGPIATDIDSLKELEPPARHNHKHPVVMGPCASPGRRLIRERARRAYRVGFGGWRRRSLAG